MEILCFYAGIALVYTKSGFPLLFVLLLFFFKANRRFILWFGAAIAWAFLHQYLIRDVGMPHQPIIQDAVLEGTILSIPAISEVKSQFLMQVYHLNQKQVKSQVLLACYQHCPTVKLGQKWQVWAKLKRPINLGNPGHFDYERMLMARHVNWTGYFQGKRARVLDDRESRLSILHSRDTLANTLKTVMANPDHLGIVQALTLGITTAIRSEQWALFRRTGTTHLMVISGAHIGLIATMTYWFTRKLWSLSASFCLYFPALQMGGICALFMAFAYAMLAGFAIPAQRSLIACICLLLAPFLQRRISSWQAWRYGLFMVLLFEPHAVLLPGFYLSFLAVATLMIANRCIVYKGYKKFLLVQLACLLGLFPFSLYWFSYAAVNGLFANLIAIPLVGYVIIPLSLICLFLTQLGWGSWSLLLLDLSLKALLLILKWIDKLDVVNITQTLPTFLSMIASCLAIVLTFVVPYRLWVPANIILLLSAFNPHSLSVKKGEARVDVLDVGQGLSVVINTMNHTLIYDTGMMFYQGGDMAQRAIIPYLIHQGIKKIDRVVISHPDLDHRGGLVSLEKNYSIAQLIVDNVPFYQRGYDCHHYPAWEWDGVFFRFLPIHQSFQGKNNTSCVLLIRSKAGSVLLPGDIEKQAEHYLVSTFKEEMRADVLVVAHHGSKTSSTPAFIQQVKPRYALISAGFDNRYHFPHQKTLMILKAFHSKLFNTMHCGMISLVLPTQGVVKEPTCYQQRSLQ